MSKRYAKPLIVGLFLACSIASFWSGQATAATNQGPNPDDFSQSGRYGNDFSGVARQVDYVVATSAYNYIPETRIKIFMPSPNGTIVINNSNICYATFRNGGRNFDLADDSNRNGSTGNSVSYTIGAQVRWGAWDGAGDCDGKSVSIPVSGASLDSNTGMYVYTLVAVANPAAARYMHTFWVVAPAGSIVSQDSSLSAISGFGMNQTWPMPTSNNPSNTQNPPAPYKNYTNWGIKFAPDCSVTSPTVTRTIETYDDDNAAFSSSDNWAVQPRRFRAGLQEYNRAGVFQRMVPPSISFPDGSGGSVDVGSGFYEVYTSGSNRRIHMTYTFNRDMIYQWVLDSVYVDNTLQFKIPFDNVYYYRQCQTNNFNLIPDVSAFINGAPSTGATAEVGDTISFNYNVNNAGTTPSAPASCTIYGRTYTGFQAVPVPPDTTSDAGYVPPATGCPRTFPNGISTPLATETLTATTANRTICRALWVNPATPGGAPAGREACVPVGNKPYMRVYGGDVSAGNGPPGGTCTGNPEGAVVSWNRGSANGFAGAGAQFAVFALDQIYEFSSVLGNTGGAAPAHGMTFANTSVSGSVYGGNFGALACIPDFYGAPVNNPLPNTNLGSAAVPSGAYTAAGPVTLSGTLPTSKRVTVYVTGNVIINGNIQYPASWTSGSTPLVEIVARGGNIYIGSGVTRLDGLYVAQRNGGVGGTIYTCATGGAPVVNTSLAATCGSKLTVNGAFAAYQVQFLRSGGTVRQSAANETPAGGAAAEVFLYSPSLWMARPMGQTTNDYDAITSLPPIL